MALVLRYADESDIHFVYNLICDLENEKFHYEIFQANYNHNLLNKNLDYYIIEQNENRSGFISLYVNLLLHHNAQIMEIQEFILLESMRGQGLGKQAIEEVINLAKQKNIHQIEVCTNKNRVKAQQFYKNLNFQESHYKYCLNLTE